MYKIRPVFLASLLIALSILAAGCGPASPADLTDEQVVEITRNILTALDTGDYAAFTRDFSDEMGTALPESQFHELRDMLHKYSGKFVHPIEMSLSNKQGFAVYRITCKYEYEDVVVTVVFRIKGKQVEGLFFDSPYLRATPKTASTPSEVTAVP